MNAPTLPPRGGLYQSDRTPAHAPALAAAKLVRRFPRVARQELWRRYDAMQLYDGAMPADVRSALAEILAAIPPPAIFEQARAVLDRAIAIPADHSEALTIVGRFLDGFGHRGGDGAAGHISALVEVLVDHDIAEDDEAPISIEALALAVTHLRRVATFRPTPSELRTTCIEMRDRLIGKRLDLIDIADDLLPLRERVGLDLSDDATQCRAGWEW